MDYDDDRPRNINELSVNYNFYVVCISVLLMVICGCLGVWIDFSYFPSEAYTCVLIRANTLLASHHAMKCRLLVDMPRKLPT